MALIDLNLGNVPDQTTVPVGEYKLRIVNADVRNSEKTGGQYLYIVANIEGEPNAYPVSHVIMFPSPNDDETDRMRRLRRVKQFISAIGLDPSQPFDTADLIGQSFTAVLDVEEDDEYGERNRIKRIL